MVLVTLTQGQSDGETKKKALVNRIIKPSSQKVTQLKDGWVFTLSAILLGGLLLGLFSFNRPLLEPQMDEVKYQHSGQFSYAAVASPSVYDQGRIQSGDAIFHSLVSSFETSFDYSFTSNQIETSQGSFQLLLELSEPNGWQRRMVLIPDTSFQNGRFQTSAEIDLDNILSLVETLRERTEFNRVAFDLKITPIVLLEATIAGQPIEDSFAPALHFKLDEFQLYLNGTNPFEETGDPLNPVKLGSLPQIQQVPARMNILGIELNVENARWIAGIALFIGVAGLGIVLYPVISRMRDGEKHRIAVQHAELIISVDQPPKAKATNLTIVERFEDLAKLAQSSNLLVFHFEDKNKNDYYLQLDERTYLYTIEEHNQEEPV
jgi:hypothetical protein